MLTIFDPVRNLDILSIIAKLFLAFAAGAAIGLERSYHNKPAGFRTHILVVLGAAIAAMTGTYLYLYMHLPTDVSRIAAGVVSGLGFIGAGTIVVTKKHKVKGLTTAAGLWVSGLIGLAIGSGFYEGGIIGTVMILLVETYFSNVRSKIQQAPEFDIALSYYHRTDLDAVLRHVKDRDCAITNLRITGNKGENAAVYSALVTLKCSGEHDPAALAKEIDEMSGIISAEVI